MSERPDENDRSEDDEERTPDQFGTRLGEQLGKLLEFLDEHAAQERGAPSRPSPGGPSSDRIGIEYDLSINTGLDSSEMADGQDHREHEPRRRVRRTRAPSDEYPATIREVDGDVVITADLQGVEESDVTVGIAGDEFVVRAGRTTVARVPVAEDTTDDIEATFNNFVLDVQIPGEAIDGAPEEVVDG